MGDKFGNPFIKLLVEEHRYSTFYRVLSYQQVCILNLGQVSGEVAYLLQMLPLHNLFVLHEGRQFHIDQISGLFDQV